jgi:hypothetical protein
MAGLYERLGHASPCLLQLAALCPELFASALGPPMARDLKSGNGGVSDARAGPIAALLCLWGRTHEVVQLIAKGLEGIIANTNNNTDAAAAAGKRKRATAAATTGLDAELAALGVLPPKRALAMLDHLLGGAQGSAAAKARALLLAAEMGGEGDGGAGKIRAALAAVRAAAGARVAGGINGDDEEAAAAAGAVRICLSSFLLFTIA